MSFNCLSELTEKIAETDRIARLAKDLLEGSEIISVHGELSEPRNRRSTANAMTKAALVLLSGYFEGFLKKLVEEFVDGLNDLKLPLQHTGDQLLLSIFQHSITDNRNKSLSKALSIKACISESSHFPLIQAAIGGTRGNPTVDNVESIFEKLGITAIIDKLSLRDYALDTTYTIVSQSQQLHKNLELALSGDITYLQKVIEIIDGKWSPKKQRRDVGYVGRIQALLKKRNRIAHGENWEEQVTPTELLEFNHDILKLCTGIHEYLLIEFESYKALDSSSVQ